MIFPSSWQVNVHRPYDLDAVDVFVYRYLDKQTMEFKTSDGGTCKMKDKWRSHGATPPPYIRLAGIDLVTIEQMRSSYNELTEEIGDEILDEAIAHHRTQHEKLSAIRHG